ncbi:hypothetical protein [Glaciecola punicea]|uniref:hypothetical protein n=1 Tax=Glaciecola punicea TaxID=56804 RepID=UPI0003111968|nr:hypothetical protein [Glaciecola punicea]
MISQQELPDAREKLGVFNARLGITELAQVSERDMSTPELLAETDAAVLKRLTISYYFKFILMTITGRGRSDRIKKSCLT